VFGFLVLGAFSNSYHMVLFLNNCKTATMSPSLGVIKLIETVPRTVAYDFDPLQYFSWWVYGGTAIVYTAFAFRGELPRQGALIFSKQNARSFSGIVTIHLAFLTILFALMRVVVYIYPGLPDWMTNTTFSNGARTVVDILFIVTMIALHYIERRWLYTAPETGAKSP
jgi:hypothetical protein